MPEYIKDNLSQIIPYLTESVGEMIRLLGVMLLFTFLLACTRTENGLVLGTPAYEKRNIHVSKLDLDILLKADELLGTEESWTQSSKRTCGNSNKLSLYCALEHASIAVNGKYVHRQAALQEVRFAIDDLYRGRWQHHRLADFNSNENTTFHDIKKTLRQAIGKVQQKLVSNQSQF